LEPILRPMTDQRTEGTGLAPRVLRRRTTDRVLGGVAGGLGDYFNIDPLLIRIAFVGLMIFGGAGLVLYVVAWLLIPAEGQEASVIEGLLRRLGLVPVRLGVVILIAGLIVLFLTIVNGAYFSLPSFGGTPEAFWAVVIIAVGVLLLRRRGEASAIAAERDATHEAETAPTRVAALPRPPSPLGWYVVAAVLLTVGVLAIVSQVAERPVSPGQFFGATFAVIGIGLVIGAWWGRARILILLAMVLLPFAILASFITTPLEGGVGNHEYAPVSVAELRSEYRSMGGRIILDLTNLGTDQRTFHIAASVGVGQLVVILPERASVEVRTRVGAGDSVVLGSREAGTSLDDRYVRHHLSETTYVLDLEVGIGNIFVTNSGINW
jgi:phage shock protein PspC (stress-responsive transcriptional regulator)